MKKIVKIAFALISLAFASQVFALECGGLNLPFLGSNGQPHCSAEEAGAADRARMNRYGANTGTVFVQRAPVYVHQPVIVHTMPQGYGYRDCTAGEVIQRDLLMAGRGLIAGLLIGDSSRAAGIGAGTGLLFSITGSCRVAVRQVATETLGNQGGVVGTARQCQAGLSWKVLDWPGHPQHGKANCLPSDDVLAQQRATSQPAASGERVCTTAGTTWKKLDWPGHHQHGIFACLPSDEKIAEQKAASQKAPKTP